MALTCLNNRIGILGCDAETTPAPQLYVNHLPGITLENIAALVNNEQETFLGLWNNIVQRTLLKFIGAVKAKINECLNICDTGVIECLICSQPELFDIPLWYLHGVELMIERTATDEMNRYTTVDLEKAERLKQEFYNEFETTLGDAVKSMDLTKGGCITTCIESNEPVRWVFQTP